jgi:hypothetical protein
MTTENALNNTPGTGHGKNQNRQGIKSMVFSQEQKVFDVTALYLLHIWVCGQIPRNELPFWMMPQLTSAIQGLRSACMTLKSALPPKA